MSLRPVSDGILGLSGDKNSAIMLLKDENLADTVKTCLSSEDESIVRTMLKVFL